MEEQYIASRLMDRFAIKRIRMKFWLKYYSWEIRFVSLCVAYLVVLFSLLFGVQYFWGEAIRSSFIGALMSVELTFLCIIMFFVQGTWIDNNIVSRVVSYGFSVVSITYWLLAMENLQSKFLM